MRRQKLIPITTRGCEDKRYLRGQICSWSCWRLTAYICMSSLLIAILCACATNTTMPKQVKSLPTAITQTATVVAVPKGTLLYKADWSHGGKVWQSTPGWRIEHGQLVTESNEGVTISIPYTSTTPNYALEIRTQIVRLLHRDGGYFSIFAKPTVTKDGYQVGVSDLKGTEPRPNGSHPQAQAYIDPASSMERGSSLPIDYEPHFDWHTYRVEVKDNEVSLYIDDVAVGTADSTRTDMLSNGPINLGSAMIVLHISSLSITAL